MKGFSGLILFFGNLAAPHCLMCFAAVLWDDASTCKSSSVNFVASLHASYRYEALYFQVSMMSKTLWKINITC